MSEQKITINGTIAGENIEQQFTYLTAEDVQGLARNIADFTKWQQGWYGYNSSASYQYKNVIDKVDFVREESTGYYTAMIFYHAVKKS